MAKKLFNKVAIVGVGLIGGSIGMAVKKLGLAREVVGVTKTESSAQMAVDMKAVDRVCSLIDAIDRADLVILASPVLAIIDHIKEIAKNADLVEGPVIDVGSSKTEIEETARLLEEKGITFIGCHPMAGSEKRGVVNAQTDLFNDSVCFVMKHNRKIDELWNKLGVKKIIKISAQNHDAFVSSVSHLTHLVAFAFLCSVDKKKIVSMGELNPSFKALVRLAKSDPEIWADIFVSNHRRISEKLKDLKTCLDLFEKNLKNRDALLELIQDSKKTADQLLPNDGSKKK